MMKKKLMLFIFFIFLMVPLNVKADNIIYRIDMDVFIDKSGNAQITEIWDVDGDNGTEWYKVINNLDGSELTNFKVSMDGNDLKYKEWDIDESLSQKKGYYGINYTSSGLELCFGKYDYKRHTFKLSYDLSNFIINTSDSQVLQWNLIDRLSNVDFRDYSIVIHSYYDFPDTLDVWGYGYKGYAYVKDGKIYAQNEENTNMNDRYVALLVKFPLSTFDTQHTKAGFSSFDDVFKRGEEGKFDYNYDYNYEESTFDKIINAIIGFFSFIFPVGIIAAAVAAAVKSGYGYKDNKTINKKEVPMFRDIPCNKDIYYANALIYLNNFGYKETNIFGAIILKWLREDKISFKNEKRGLFNKDTSMIDLTLNPTFNLDVEKDLFDMMYKASKDGLLEPNELEKWAKNHYEKFLGLFTRIKNYKIDELKAANHIYKRQNKEECKKKNVMDDIIYDDSVKLYGLRKFLQEFSDMKNKEAIEVKLWDEYLMFAYLFGMAEKVAKQFKNLYPEIVREMEANNLDYGTFVYINNLSARTVHAASAARSAAESYSGGGGGFSSGGGGGGFSGGGGGGSR